MSEKPKLHIIAGPNGAGKTTFAREFLPSYADCLEFVNADLLAQGLSPFDPESAAIKAGRLMLDRINELSNKRVTFGFETTLSGRTYINLIKRLQAEGYSVKLYFLWLQSVEAAVARVAERVSQGGHNIPEATIRRRYKAGLRNFFSSYERMVDEWAIFDSSAGALDVVAQKIGGMVSITERDIYERMKEAGHG